MRIAVFTDSYRPQINGVVTSIDSFVGELKRRGHEVFIFAPDDPEAKKEKNVFRIRSFKFFGYKEYRIALPFGLMAKFPIEKIKPDVIHIHSPFSLGFLGLKVAKQYNIPAVVTFHTMYPDYMHYVTGNTLLKVGALKNMFHGTAWLYLRWFHNMCTEVIAPTPAIKSLLARHGIKRKISVIPTGAVRKKIDGNRNILKKKHGFKGEKIILHVGRVTKEKNIDFMIKSMSNILESGEYKFVVTSDGPYRKYLENLTKDLGLENVIFTGFISDKELAQYYEMADVFVMASETETQGIVLLDAAFFNTPSVVVDAPVIADFVSENKTGLVASRKNFAEKVRYVAEKKPSFASGFKKVKKDYSIEKCVDDLLEVYNWKE